MILMELPFFILDLVAFSFSFKVASFLKEKGHPSREFIFI